MRNKFIMIVMLFVMGLCLLGCENTQNQPVELTAPINVKIENGVLSFDKVDGAAKYRIEAKDNATGAVQKRFVEPGVDLNTLNLPEGTYEIKLQALSSDNKNESEYVMAGTFKQLDLYAVKLIEGDQLIDGNYIKWMGRTSYDTVNKVNTVYYSAGGFEVKAKKVDAELTVTATITATNTNTAPKRPYIVLVKDGDFNNTITMCLTSATTVVNLVGEGGFNVEDEDVHTFAVYKRSESIDSHIALKQLETSGKFVEGVTYKERKIEVIAASSSTGYGNLGTSSGTKDTSNSDALHAFAFLTAQALNAEINIVSASGWGISASRWTTPNTINMKDRYKYVDVFSDELWDTTKYVPDVIVTNFGTNDLSYINLATGAEKEKRTENFISSYVEFLDNLHTTYPNAKIVIIYGLMLESGIYAEHQEIFNRAIKNNPELQILQVQGDAKGCSSHPSVASHQKIAESLTAKIKEMTNW